MKETVFTQEEIEILKANPYTLSVTKYSIRFTLAFKQTLWLRRQAGDRIHNIFTDLGYDMDIIGLKRAKSISTRIRNEALSPDGLHENNNRPKLHPEFTTFQNMPYDEAMIRMQHELLYMRQELEFIKKIIKTDNSGGPKQ